MKVKIQSRRLFFGSLLLCGGALVLRIVHLVQHPGNFNDYWMIAIFLGLLLRGLYTSLSPEAYAKYRKNQDREIQMFHRSLGRFWPTVFAIPALLLVAFLVGAIVCPDNAAVAGILGLLLLAYLVWLFVFEKTHQTKA